MNKEEMFNRMKENSIGSYKRTSARFNKKKARLNGALTALLSIVIAFSLVGCGITSDKTDEYSSRMEYSQIYNDYGYTYRELKVYEVERIDKLLEDNGLIKYTRDDNRLRNYQYTVEDYKSMEGLDETYLHAFYYVSNDESVDRFAKALGYEDLHDYLAQHDYLTSEGKTDEQKWYREYTIELAKIKNSEENSKGMSL